MLRYFYTLLLSLFLLVGCNNNVQFEGGKTYKFQGEVLSLVEQKDWVLDNLKINYTLTLLGFKPDNKVFDVYNSQFIDDPPERYIVITDVTKVYNESKKTISPIDLKREDMVEFIVRIANDSYLEAIEINVIKSSN